MCGMSLCFSETSVLTEAERICSGNRTDNVKISHEFWFIPLPMGTMTAFACFSVQGSCGNYLPLLWLVVEQKMVVL